MMVIISSVVFLLWIRMPGVFRAIVSAYEFPHMMVFFSLELFLWIRMPGAFRAVVSPYHCLDFIVQDLGPVP